MGVPRLVIAVSRQLMGNTTLPDLYEPFNLQQRRARLYWNRQWLRPIKGTAKRRGDLAIDLGNLPVRIRNPAEFVAVPRFPAPYHPMNTYFGRHSTPIGKFVSHFRTFEQLCSADPPRFPGSFLEGTRFL